MILISHRGNIFGPNPEEENKPDYILKAIQAGFHVEVDFWLIDYGFYLGHDHPQYRTTISFIYGIKNRLWAHAKNKEALLMLLDMDVNCFWHENDERTLTSHGYIWTYPGQEIASRKAIAVMPETVDNWDVSFAAGICSDYVGNYTKGN